MTDFTSESSDPNGAGLFDFLSTQAEGAWDFATAVATGASDTAQAGFEALPDVTVDTGDVPDPTDFNLWPVALGGAALLAAAYVFTK